MLLLVLLSCQTSGSKIDQTNTRGGTGKQVKPEEHKRSPSSPNRNPQTGEKQGLRAHSTIIQCAARIQKKRIVESQRVDDRVHLVRGPCAGSNVYGATCSQEPSQEISATSHLLELLQLLLEIVPRVGHSRHRPTRPCPALPASKACTKPYIALLFTAVIGRLQQMG